jgi:serpin B
MTGRPPEEGGVYIGRIVHRAVIETAEEYTEAAAATGIAMERSVMPSLAPSPVEFRADHPFLFYLVDDTTGAILFQGRVADPGG